MKPQKKEPIKITITPTEITRNDPLAAVTSHVIRNDSSHNYDATAANMCEAAKLLAKLDGRELIVDDQRPAAPVATPPESEAEIDLRAEAADQEWHEQQAEEKNATRRTPAKKNTRRKVAKK